MLHVRAQQVMIGSFVYATSKISDEALAMTPSPLDEIIRLRGQAESQAKHEGLYTKRSKDWISWEEAQQARVRAEKAYKSLPAGTAPGKKMQTLREWLAISCFTLMPPDRVVRLSAASLFAACVCLMCAPDVLLGSRAQVKALYDNQARF